MERSEAAYEGTRASWKLHAVASSKGLLHAPAAYRATKTRMSAPRPCRPRLGKPGRFGSGSAMLGGVAGTARMSGEELSV
jgi:hypothetical protein